MTTAARPATWFRPPVGFDNAAECVHAPGAPTRPSPRCPGVQWGMKGLGLAVALLGLLGGCASKPAPAGPAQGPYAALFAAAKETLIDEGFELERVDARAGVLTTRPKRTAGVATPWDREQSSLGQEWEDFINLQRRTVRVTFALEGEVAADLREAEGPVGCGVVVVVDRVQVPGWRIEPEAVALSTYTYDPVLAARGMSPRHVVPQERDTLLEERLTREIAARLAKAAPAADRAGE